MVSLVEPKSQDRRLMRARLQHKAILICGDYRSDRCALWVFGDFEAEDTHRSRKASVDAKQGAVVKHSSDGDMTRIPYNRGHFVFQLPPYKHCRERMASTS
jgi:hypothetical protein